MNPHRSGVKCNASGRTLLLAAGMPPLALEPGHSYRRDATLCGPGAEMTVTFVLGLPGAWPRFFLAAKPHGMRVFPPFGIGGTHILQDIVKGKSLPIAAGTHPLSPGKSGT
jgi:hypothetical protein